MASLSRIRLFEEVKQTWACFDDEAGRAVRAKAVGKVGLRLSSVRAIYTGLFFFSTMRQRTGGLSLSRNSQYISSEMPAAAEVRSSCLDYNN